jgi:hypothetical protein
VSECLERGGLIVRGALLPTAIENADPLECQGPYGGLVCLALVTLLLVIDLCPEGMPDRFRCPFHERLAEERRTLPTPVHPGLLAPAFRDRCDARIFLECLGGGEAFPLFAEGHAEAGGKDGPRPWQGVTQGEVGMGLGALGHGSVEIGNGLPGHAELGDKGWHQEGLGGDHACIRGQRPSVLDGLNAGGDDVGRAHVVGTEKALQGGTTRELDGFQGRPAAQEVAKDRRVFVLKPLQDVGEVVFERTRQAIRQPDCVADEAPAVFDELRQGAHRGALRDKGGEFVTVFAQDLDLECGIGGVIFGPARGKRFAVLGHGEWIDGKEHEAIIVLPRSHKRAFIEFQADGNRLAVAARAQGAAPRVDRFRTVGEPQKLPVRRTGDLSADIVCGIRPVKAHKGRKCFGGLWLHG